MNCKYKEGQVIKKGNTSNNFVESSALIDLNCALVGNFKIHDGVKVKHCSYIVDSEICNNAVIFESVIEDSVIGKNTTVGPYCHIRPKSVVGNNCKLGNFVEIKNSKIGDNTKISHLAYVGDADIGSNCNIGCGVIFANYNGRSKNRIIVGNNCFIGSNCNLIAPLSIADNTYICAGTTVTKDTSPYDFVIGRVREEVKPNRAIDYLKEKDD